MIWIIPENEFLKPSLSRRFHCRFCFRHSSDITTGLLSAHHRKYNPIERCFGWLEQHWNGSLLDTVETVLNFAQTFTFKGKNPDVKELDSQPQLWKKLKYRSTPSPISKNGLWKFLLTQHSYWINHSVEFSYLKYYLQISSKNKKPAVAGLHKKL